MPRPKWPTCVCPEPWDWQACEVYEVGHNDALGDGECGLCSHLPGCHPEKRQASPPRSLKEREVDPELPVYGCWCGSTKQVCPLFKGQTDPMVLAFMKGLNTCPECKHRVSCHKKVPEPVRPPDNWHK